MNTELKAKNNFLKRSFQVNEQFSFWKNYGECKKIYRH